MFPKFVSECAAAYHELRKRGTRIWDYKSGDFIVEMIDAWHYGMNIGSEPVRLLVIDQVEAGQGNVVLQ